jgi:hypothetical protein
MNHGKVSSYANGKCRCDRCKRAWSEYQSRYRKDNRKATAAITDRYRRAVAESRDETGMSRLIKTHGLPGSYNSGCRCQDCRSANNKKQKNYYSTKTGKASIKKSNRVQKEKLKKWISDQRKLPCADCGLTFPPEAMDFDHLNASGKILSISTMVKKHFSKSRIIAEIAKCEVVCANCHRVRTAKRLSALLK